MGTIIWCPIFYIDHKIITCTVKSNTTELTYYKAFDTVYKSEIEISELILNKIG